MLDLRLVCVIDRSIPLCSGEVYIKKFKLLTLIIFPDKLPRDWNNNIGHGVGKWG